MSGLRNSNFAKRLRATYNDQDEEGDEDIRPQRNRPRINPIFDPAAAAGHGSSTPTLDSSAATTSDSDSPIESRAQREYTDRFVPSRDSGDIRTSYHLLEDGAHTPKKIIPSESDALREQANLLFSSVLQTEVAPDLPPAPGSPARNTNTLASTSGGVTTPSTPSRKRLFAFHTPGGGSNPGTPRRLDTPTDEAYSLSPIRAESRQLLLSPRKQPRFVTKTPYRVLDAPDLKDDFYLNLVDWSSTNVLAVGLGPCVYLWTAHTAAVNKLCDLQGTDSISSVSWVRKGSTLAVGTVHGKIHIYDTETLQLTRTYNRAHEQRIGALSWNDYILSSGSRDRMVYHRDAREPGSRPFKRGSGHRQEVCGLRWSAGGAQEALLASGGNDNKVCIWDLRGSHRASNAARATGASAGPSGSGSGSGPSGSGSGTSSTGGGHARSGSNVTTTGSADDTSQGSGDMPLYKFHEHHAAVKALAWDPHMPGLLASGGGTQDKRILFWNVPTGQLVNQLDTGSQICNLTWSLTSHELVSTHGFSSTTAQNQICIWKYPTLSMVASLGGHTHRVLYLAMSPDGETIVTGAGDETLRFWSAFPKEEKERKTTSRLDPAKLIR